MQELQNTQSHPSSANISANLDKTNPTFTPALSESVGDSSHTIRTSTTPYSDLPISIIEIIAILELSSLTEDQLPQLGNQLAILLAKVLDELEKNNQEAIGPIVSILEPYMPPTPDFKIHIPPKSSREVTIQLTDLGRVLPKIYLD